VDRHWGHARLSARGKAVQSRRRVPCSPAPHAPLPAGGLSDPKPCPSAVGRLRGARTPSARSRDALERTRCPPLRHSGARLTRTAGSLRGSRVFASAAPGIGEGAASRTSLRRGFAYGRSVGTFGLGGASPPGVPGHERHHGERIGPFTIEHPPAHETEIPPCGQGTREPRMAAGSGAPVGRNSRRFCRSGARACPGSRAVRAPLSAVAAPLAVRAERARWNADQRPAGRPAMWRRTPGLDESDWGSVGACGAREQSATSPGPLASPGQRLGIGAVSDRNCCGFFRTLCGRGFEIMVTRSLTWGSPDAPGAGLFGRTAVPAG
jgi:hypothetical protein